MSTITPQIFTLTTVMCFDTNEKFIQVPSKKSLHRHTRIIRAPRIYFHFFTGFYFG